MLDEVWIAAGRHYRIVNDHAPGTVIMVYDLDRDRPALLPLAFWKAQAVSATLGRQWTGPTTAPVNYTLAESLPTYETAPQAAPIVTAQVPKAVPKTPLARRAPKPSATPLTEDLL